MTALLHDRLPTTKPRAAFVGKRTDGKIARLVSTYAVMPMSPNIDDRPACSKCNVEMLRSIAEPIVPGYELRNFECPSCGNKLKLVGYEGLIKTMSKPE
jgi:predicted RNA-binding Zn-ribbon protein involved in translation (DUF1610 family)